MPKVISASTLIGEIEHQWTVKEFEKHHRPPAWYIVMGTFLALFVLFGVFSGNFLFSLVIVLAAIILFIQGKQDPIDVSFAITTLGVIVGNRFYPYTELIDFYIVYEPPEVKMLFLETRSPVRPLLRVPLNENNPIQVRRTLRQYLQENLEKEEEPAADAFARRWRLH